MGEENKAGFAAKLFGLATGNIGLSIGSTLAGSVLNVFSERDQRRELEERQIKAIQPLKDRFETAKVGLSSTEGGLVRSAVDRSLTGLAQRGVLDSSIAAGEVSRAVAPIEAAAAGRRDALAERLAAAQFQIANTGALPGYAGAFGDSFSDIGGYLALIEGIKQGGAAFGAAKT